MAVSGSFLCVASSEARGRVFVVDLDECRTVAAWGFSAPDGGYADAAGVALDARHHIYVADPLNDVVRCFSPFGRELDAFGTPPERGAGSITRDRPGRLDAPYAVAVRADRLWVAGGSGWLRRGVQCFAMTDGACLGWLHAFGDVEGEFGAPRGLAVVGNELLVADTLNGVIQRFRFDGLGRYLAHFHTAHRPGEASRPVAVVGLGDGDVLIADEGDRPGLRRFAIEGGERRGWSPDPRLELDRPHALATDDRGCVYVLDRDGGRVQRMHPDLSFDRLVVDLAEIAP
jgi:sugar lactone lactonase YvrE